MKKQNTKIRLTKGVLLISFLILLIRLIYSSISAFYYWNENSSTKCSSLIETKNNDS